jgi:putative nucleotidyltransferase with HDIG domain
MCQIPGAVRRPPRESVVPSVQRLSPELAELHSAVRQIAAVPARERDIPAVLEVAARAAAALLGAESTVMASGGEGAAAVAGGVRSPDSAEIEAGFASMAAPVRVMGDVWGALSVAGEPAGPHTREWLEALAGAAAIAIVAADPDMLTASAPDADDPAEAGDDAAPMARTALRALAAVVDARHPVTHNHSLRVAELAFALARELRWPRARARLLYEAALLHDMGKVAIPDRVLLKNGPLSAEEYEVVKHHAALGADIAASVLTEEQASWVRNHHERWDGKGYPDRLARREIPDGARVIAVADAWDVMTQSRPYRTPIDRDEALEECLEEAGYQLDPEVVAALSRLSAREGIDLVVSS